jgi:hypothetical protein
MAADSPGAHQDEDEEPAEDEREVTPVGQASKALLELSSSSGDQNTRAYQAPRELLDLARRQQAKRAQACAAAGSLQPSAAPSPAASLQPSAAPSPAASLQPSAAPQRAASLQPPASPRLLDDDAAPPRPIGESVPPRDRPTRRPARSQRIAESSTPSISVEPASSSLEGINSDGELEAPEPESSDRISVNDAAPSVARSRPSRSLSDAPAPSSVSSSSEAPPASLSELVRAVSASDPASSAAPSARAAVPDSAAASSARQPQRMPLPVLVMIISICLLIGFVLAKWRGLELLLPRH